MELHRIAIFMMLGCGLTFGSYGLIFFLKDQLRPDSNYSYSNTVRTQAEENRKQAEETLKLVKQLERSVDQFIETRNEQCK